MTFIKFDQELTDVFVKLHFLDDNSEAGLYAELKENGGWLLEIGRAHV